MCGVQNQVRTRSRIRWVCLTESNYSSFVPVDKALVAVQILEPSNMFMNYNCQQGAALDGDSAALHPRQ